MITKLLLAIILTSVTDTVRISFIGDVMQHYPQLKSAHITGTDTLLSESYDYSSYFKYVTPELENADFAVANMEFAAGAVPYSGYPSFSAPGSLPEAAAEAGIDLFLCANNHICDKGRRGLESTIRTYSEIGIPFTGLYPDQARMQEDYPFITDICGIKVAFINFTYGTNGIRVPAPYAVTSTDTTQIADAILRAKEKGAEFIIALPHWGIEYSLEASKAQIFLKEFLLSKGVDAIIGTHPHVIQPVISTCEGDTITSVTAYSLGNFISNMSKTNTQAGYLFTLSIIRDEDGSVRITDYDAEMLWCARRLGPESGFTTIPVKEFLSREDDFRSKNEFIKMKKTYESLNIFFKNGE